MKELKISQKVNSVSKYIENIFKLRSFNIENENDSNYWFFRGQKSSDWSARPSAFRNDALSIESNVIQHALRQRPYDFRECQTDFEILTKLQHYGLGTRLLDVTLNPLVALFFACETFDNLEYGKDKRAKLVPKDGKVFFKYAYGHKVGDLYIQIACALPFIEISKDESIDFLLNTLRERGTITAEEYTYLSNDNYSAFVSAIQRNYFVVSSYSNDRLIRQSGSFIVPTAIKILKHETTFSNSIVRKTFCDLDSEFENDYFIIPHEKKEEILEELDFLNINKATLFPELEHQLTYLQSKKFISKIHIENFEKINETLIATGSEARDENDYIPPNPQISEIVLSIIHDKSLAEKTIEIIRLSTSLTDWWMKDTVLSKLRVDISHTLQDSFSANDSKSFAKAIVDKLLTSDNDET